MHEMENGSRSSEGFIKKKSSSGCLIIKKKPIFSGGISRNVPRSNDERERRNFGINNSGSSEDSLEPVRKCFLPRDNKFSEGILGNNNFGRNGEFEGEKRGRFDENVGMNRKRMRKDDLQEREIDSTNRQYFRVPSNKTIRVQGKNGVLKVMVNKSKNLDLLCRYYDHQMEDVDRFNKSGSNDVDTNLFLAPCENTKSVRIEKSEPKLQNLLLKPELKSEVNRKNNLHMIHKGYDYQQKDWVKKDSNLEIEINEKTPVPVLDSNCKNEKSKSLKAENNEIKLQNSLSKRVKSGDFLLNCKKISEQIGGSSKGVKSEEKTQSGEKEVPVKGRETKVNRGTGTEKQLLREKIRYKLLNAGWKIDYRPRKNRDYLDAVYINPAGTAYWSIIKAYEAFKKHIGEEDVPEESLNKLTRQTKKKKEMELIMNQREEDRNKNIEVFVREEEAEDDTENDDNGEKLSFLNKTNSNLLKPKAEKPIQEKKTKQIGTSKNVKREKEDEDGRGNDDKCEKISFLNKTNSKSLKQKAEKPIEERKSKQIVKSMLMVHDSDKGLRARNDDYIPYMGKRTVLSWLIDSGIINENAKVQYMNHKRTKPLLKGWIGRDGIHCGCCSKIVTVSKFEIHAGSKLREPYQNIFLENGISLFQCQIEAWKRQDQRKRCGFLKLEIDGDDGNDDACGLCGDGGGMICCDGCPSTFHQNCIGIQTLPPGDWHCPNCMCKFCERSSAHGNALLTCSMCERKYHGSCGEEIDALSADFNIKSTSFCAKQCQEMFNQLQKLLEVKHELRAGFTWSLIHRADIDTYIDTDINTDALQHGFPQKVECNSKLAVALSVIEECFLPTNDRRSGINLIHNVLYNRGSNYSRLNHSGFYTAILERGDEIIAAASIRIHGTQLAEMPFIGTRHIYRRQGMCRRLLCAIESAFSSLKIGKLVVPAVAEHMHTWTGVFGFHRLEEFHKKEMRSLKVLVFPRTGMLLKNLVEKNTIEESLSAESEFILGKEQQHLTSDVKKSSNVDPSFQHNSDVCEDTSMQNPLTKCDGAAAINSFLRPIISNADAASNSSSDICPLSQTVIS